jgi:hypothetical protein
VIVTGRDITCPHPPIDLTRSAIAAMLFCVLGNAAFSLSARLAEDRRRGLGVRTEPGLAIVVNDVATLVLAVLVTPTAGPTRCRSDRGRGRRCACDTTVGSHRLLLGIRNDTAASAVVLVFAGRFLAIRGVRATAADQGRAGAAGTTRPRIALGRLTPTRAGTVVR